MAKWIEFLDVFHGTATTTVTSAPEVNIVSVYPEVVSIYEPAVLTLEVSGRDILRVNYAVTYTVGENERAVLDFDYLVSRTTTPTGANISDWSDGVTQRVFSWDAEVPQLTDGTTSTYALLIPNIDNPTVLLVNGLYTSARGGDPIQARLLFDQNTRTSTALWGLNETASGNLQPFELQVEPGDTFQPLWLTLDANNELSQTSLGDPLVLQDVTSITFSKVPAPSGQYSISFVAENVAGDNNLSEVTFQVNNDGLDAELSRLYRFDLRREFPLPGKLDPPALYAGRRAAVYRRSGDEHGAEPVSVHRRDIGGRDGRRDPRQLEPTGRSGNPAAARGADQRTAGVCHRLHLYLRG